MTDFIEFLIEGGGFKYVLACFGMFLLGVMIGWAGHRDFGK